MVVFTRKHRLYSHFRTSNGIFNKGLSVVQVSHMSGTIPSCRQGVLAGSTDDVGASIRGLLSLFHKAECLT